LSSQCDSTLILGVDDWMVMLGLLSYIARRLLFLVFVIIGISLMTFLVSNSIPSDPIVANLGERAMNDPEIVEAFRSKWGLDKPLYQQYLIYIKNLLKGDLGTSIRTHRAVIVDIYQYFPATFELAIVASLVAIVFGISFGIISAIYRNSVIDQVVRAISLIGVSIPTFWMALVTLYFFYFHLGWAPGPGRIDVNVAKPITITGLFLVDSLLQGNWSAFLNTLKHLILPALALGSFKMGLITRTTRSSMLEVLGQDYIRTARAKGLTERLVMYRHVLSNALIPTVTVIGLGFGNLLGGTVLVETIFAWPGIGRYAYQSAIGLDIPAIMGASIVITTNFVLINLIVDLLYGFLDPRVRLR